LNDNDLTVDGGRLNLQKQGVGDPDWALEVEDETLRFIEPDDGDRVVLEVLDAHGDLTNPILRLQGAANATLSASQVIGATTTDKGLVEIAAPGEIGVTGESGARLVVPADDPRLLTLAQKNDLTDGGLTTLHRHPNGILHNVRRVLLWAGNTTTDIAEVDLGTTKRVVAFIHMNSVDPLADFDSGDGLFADIFQIDGVRAPSWISGGAHFGPPGADSNLMIGFFTGSARRVMFRLRTMQNASVAAIGVVLFEDL
jgi:hypothetical protein